MRTSCIFAVVLFLTLTSAAAGQQGAELPQIVAAGEGEARITPELVYADLTVEQTEETAVAAANETARLVSSVRAALRGAGVAADAILDVGYTLQERTRYESGAQRHEGYQAVHTLRVETEQLDEIGNLIDAALAAGANRVRQVQYSAHDFEDARRGALTAAVARARIDAEIMARAAGGSLGSLLEVSTSRVVGPPGVSVQEQRVAAAPPPPTGTIITPRELVLRATVVGRWAFQGN